MLYALKISIYNIKVGPSSILKAPPDYNLYILAYTICLDYSWLPLLCRYMEALFALFTPPSLIRALITPYMYPPLLWSNMTIYKAPGKSFIGILLGKEWSSFTFPILNAILL